ncbi:YceD family protein [Flavicella sediminum]|uniref:YceD family protein n=1 Tax=Flavicella sediminum TaxID=2585141 RepID=UPI00111DEEAF|nr:DUF177 domain-containing protein [Flavicella sediminum]
MKELREYNLSFIGLKEGEHKFEYQIDNKFFDVYKYDEYLKADLKVDLVFVKKTNMLELDFEVSGSVNVPCDLTGEPFDLETSGKLSLIVKFGDEFNDENEEILIIPNSAHQVNVAQYIYEMIVLAVPIKRIHPEAQTGDFAQGTLEKLEELKISKKNSKDNEETTDPRWGKLKDLLIDKNQHNGTSKKKDI